MIVIENGEVFVDGHLTKDPTLIGYAILDWLEYQEPGEKMTFNDPEEFIDIN